MKKILHRAAAVLLAALLLCALAACGEQDPNAGIYLCVDVTAGEDVVSPGELYNGDVRLELRTGGSGRLLLGENEGDIRWSLEGETLSIDINGEACPGTLTDGEIRFSLPGNDVGLHLLREELAAALPTPTPQPERLADTAGDYYGWWEIENSEGGMPDTWYDCCAAAVLTKDGLVLTLWDEKTSRAQPMGVISLTDDGEQLRPSGGWFWYEDVTEDSFTLETCDDALTLSGRHDAEGERFDFCIHLRPWGAEWEDPDARPYSYRFWYLPLIEAGETMPDSIIETEGK